MARPSYDKQAVLDDIAANMPAQEISEKHGITVGNVYNIKAVARRRGLLDSSGYRTLADRQRDEETVFTPELRERIKDLRDDPMAYTSTEIARMLTEEGIPATRDDVAKVMARGADAHEKWGKLRG